MKKYKIILLLFIASFLLSGSKTTGKRAGTVTASKWSGTVSFLDKKTGPKIIISEWKMEATIDDGVATVIHSFESEDTESHSAHCRNEAETELQLGIDKEAKKYSIWVDVPGCYGTKIDHGVQSDFGQTDETAIVINDQPLPDDARILSGRLVLKDGPHDDGSAGTTTYEWNLEKDKKKKIP
jgi:hypothetical protein